MPALRCGWSAHPLVIALCEAFGGALVSTSANRAGDPPAGDFAELDPRIRDEVDAVLEGGLVPNNDLRVLLDTGSLLSLDGRRGYGQVVGQQAMALGMERAKTHGSCIMTLANSHHLGRIGHFAEMAVAQGLVSMHFVNVLSRPVVAPFGGADGRYGTNPCCIGIPLKGREPFILDFATSRVAQGKMRVAHNEGKQVEAGMLIDEFGRATTNPGVVVVPWGWWAADHMGDGNTGGQVVNSLTNDTLTDWGGGVAFSDTRVAISPL